MLSRESALVCPDRTLYMSHTMRAVWVNDLTSDPQDPHWSLYTRHCSACLVKFSAVVHIEATDWISSSAHIVTIQTVKIFYILSAG